MSNLLWRLDMVGRAALLATVRGYQRYLGWLLGGHCRFVPTCSCYAAEALQRGPLVPAVLLILWRLARCQPLCRGGMEGVPDWMNRDERWFVGTRQPGPPPDSTPSPDGP